MKTIIITLVWLWVIINTWFWQSEYQNGSGIKIISDIVDFLTFPSSEYEYPFIDPYDEHNLETAYFDDLGRYWRVWNDTLPCPFPDVFDCQIEDGAKLGKWVRHGISFRRTNEVLGYFALFLVIFFSNIWGLGGGYLTVIILYQVYGFESRKTYGYAAFFNFLAGLTRFIIEYRKTHPEKSFHTLVDYEMVMILLPLGIIGMMVGMMIYSVLPMVIIAALLALFWGIFSIDIFIRGIKARRTEKNGREPLVKVSSMLTNEEDEDSDSVEFVDRDDNNRNFLDDHLENDPKMCSLNSESKSASQSVRPRNKTLDRLGISQTSRNLAKSGQIPVRIQSNTSASRSDILTYLFSQMHYLEEGDSEAEDNIQLLERIQQAYTQRKNSDFSNIHKDGELMELQALMEKKIKKGIEKNKKKLREIQVSEGYHFTTKSLFITFGLLLLILNILSRGLLEESLFGIKQCTFEDWLSFILIGVSCFILALSSISYLNFTYKNKRKWGYVFTPCDIRWNFNEGIRLSIVSLIWGLWTGIVGLGEATVFVPLLIGLGKHPMVAFATGMIICMLFSLTIAVGYAIEGFFDDAYFLLIGAISIVASSLGVFVSHKINDRVNKKSLMIFLLSINVLAIAITLPIVVLNRRFQTGSQRDNIFEFGWFWQRLG